MNAVAGKTAIFNSAPKRPSRLRLAVKLVSASITEWSIRLVSSAAILLALPLVTLVWPSGARAEEGCHTPGGTERRDVLEAMRGAVARDLRQTIEFKISTIRVCGPWAFVVAEPLRPGGAPLQWQRTICKGDVSHLVGALEEKDPTGLWRLKDHALCPTDVAWENWPEKYGAPRALFAD